MMRTMMRQTLISVITGDALGSAVDGMTRGHINSHFRAIADYIDPGPALKSRPESWRKPGLYSSISQMMLIMAMACPRRGPCAEGFRGAVAASPDVAGCDHGIFRHPGAAERSFIERMKAPEEHLPVSELPCARIIPSITYLSFRNNSILDQVMDVMEAIRLFTMDPSTAAAALVYSFLLRAMASGADADCGPLRGSIAAAAAVVETIESNSGAIFAGSVNPGTLLRELRVLIALIEETASADSLGSAEKIIISRVNRGLKTPVTRATVNLPAALFPYALAVAALAPDGTPLPAAAMAEGGSTAALAALAGALGSFRDGTTSLEETLVRNLVNRKKVLALVDALDSGTAAPDMVDDFIRSESSLTAKERDELEARLKHGKKKQKKPQPTRSDRERELARHAVESWTKLDKARWKKERRRHDKNDDS